jgi:hypothetical protein
MLFIPTYCAACGRAALVSGNALSGTNFQCELCGGPALVIPGESYVESDVPLFEQLRVALREAAVTPALAAQLRRQVGPRDGAPGASLRRLAASVPALSNLDLIVGNNTLTLRKADGMLATLLDVIASAC